MGVDAVQMQTDAKPEVASDGSCLLVSLDVTGAVGMAPAAEAICSQNQDAPDALVVPAVGETYCLKDGATC